MPLSGKTPGVTRHRPCDDSAVTSRGLQQATTSVAGLALLLAACSSGSETSAHDRGGRALGSLALPPGISRHVPSHGTLPPACVESGSRMCLYTRLAVPTAVDELESLLGKGAHVDASSDCSGSTSRHGLPCTIRGVLGSQPAAIVITPHVVGLPPGKRAPTGVRLVSPRGRFHSYYDGNDVTVELTNN